MNTQPARRTLEQERAAFAWDRVKLLANYQENADVGMYIRRLPAMTFVNGLGQTLAFLLEKAEGKPHSAAFEVYKILADWLIQQRRIYPGNPEDLIKTIAEGNRYQYQLAQEEVWALLNWLKKFADAFLSQERLKPAINERK